MTILHLETLSAFAKGLTCIPDGLSVLEESDLSIQAEAEEIRLTRDDPSAKKLREVIFAAIKGSRVGNVRLCFYILFNTFECRTDNVHYIVGIDPQ